MPSYDATKAVQIAAESGSTVYVKVGGTVYKVPKSRANDAAALMTDLNARFKVTKRQGGSPRPLGMEVSLGPGGILVNLDRVEHFDPEVEKELGPIANEDSAADLAAYITRASRAYLGADIDAEDVRGAWEQDEPNDIDELDDEE